MAELGVHDYRFSVAWPRVHAGRLRAGRTRRGWTSTRGWSTTCWSAASARWSRSTTGISRSAAGHGRVDGARTADRFADYAGVVGRSTRRPGASFTTLNEPWCSAFLGYASGEHAPGVRDTADRLSRRAPPAARARARRCRASARPRPGAEMSITLNPAQIRPGVDGRARRAGRPPRRTDQQPALPRPLLRGSCPRGAGRGHQRRSRTGASSQTATCARSTRRSTSSASTTTGPHVVGADPDPTAQQSAGRAARRLSAHRRRDRTPAMGWRVDPASFTDLLVGAGRGVPATFPWS